MREMREKKEKGEREREKRDERLFWVLNIRVMNLDEKVKQLQKEVSKVQEYNK